MCADSRSLGQNRPWTPRKVFKLIFPVGQLDSIGAYKRSDSVSGWACNPGVSERCKLNIEMRASEAVRSVLVPDEVAANSDWWFGPVSGDPVTLFTHKQQDGINNQKRPAPKNL